MSCINCECSKCLITRYRQNRLRLDISPCIHCGTRVGSFTHEVVVEAVCTSCQSEVPKVPIC